MRLVTEGIHSREARFEISSSSDRVDDAIWNAAVEEHPLTRFTSRLVLLDRPLKKQVHELRRILVPCATPASGSLLRQDLPCGFVHAPESIPELVQDGALAGSWCARENEKAGCTRVVHGRRIVGLRSSVRNVIRGSRGVTDTVMSGRARRISRNKGTDGLSAAIWLGLALGGLGGALPLPWAFRGQEAGIGISRIPEGGPYACAMNQKPMPGRASDSFPFALAAWVFCSC